MKRSLILSCLLVLAVVVFSRCSKLQEQQNGLSVEGEVTQENYMSLGIGASPIAYHVDVTARNVGERQLDFDKIEAYFFTEEGKSLRTVKHRYDEEKGTDGDSYKTGENILTSLAPGAVEELEFSTNGYTFKLLREASGKPLKFSIIFYRDDKVVAGPYFAVLPLHIQALPQYEQTLMDDNIKGRRLTFLLAKRIK